MPARTSSGQARTDLLTLDESTYPALQKTAALPFTYSPRETGEHGTRILPIHLPTCTPLHPSRFLNTFQRQHVQLDEQFVSIKSFLVTDGPYGCYIGCLSIGEYYLELESPWVSLQLFPTFLALWFAGSMAVWSITWSPGHIEPISLRAFFEATIDMSDYLR
jgi:hypothetical protein